MLIIFASDPDPCSVDVSREMVLIFSHDARRQPEFFVTTSTSLATNRTSVYLRSGNNKPGCDETQKYIHTSEI